MSGKKAKQKRKESSTLPGRGVPYLPGSSVPRGPDGRILGVIRSSVEQEMTVSHSGPLPDPGTLREYELIIPNAGERLMVLLEKEQKHRHDRETMMTDALVTDSVRARNADLRGDIIACCFFLISEGLGAFLLINGYSEWIAASLLGAPIVSAIGSFLYRRRSRNLQPQTSPPPEK